MDAELPIRGTSWDKIEPEYIALDACLRVSGRETIIDSVIGSHSVIAELQHWGIASQRVRRGARDLALWFALYFTAEY